MLQAPSGSEHTSGVNGLMVRGAPCQAGFSIAYKELFPIVIAAFIWGPQWSRQHILFRSDNEAVVHILTTRTSRTVDLMFLLRKLLLAPARFNLMFTEQDVPGVHNSIADVLSRFHWQEFRRLAPEAQQNPVSVPVQLWQDLISLLSRQCQQLLMEGLAPTTRSTYLSGQKRFIEFCTHFGKLGPDGSPCPAEEWTLCLFVTHLAQSVQYATIKVYLAAVRALHIEQGFLDPLVDCYRLQRVLRGV